jgi:hypothetical protein
MGLIVKTVPLQLKILSRGHARSLLQTTQGRKEPRCLHFPESWRNTSWVDLGKRRKASLNQKRNCIFTVLLIYANTLISQINNLWSYLWKPVGDWTIERPRNPRIKSGNYFWYVKLATKWVSLLYWMKYVYTLCYTSEVMYLSLWRFDPITCHGLSSLDFMITFIDTHAL